MTNWITVEDSLKGRALAVERERERIIKLLEEDKLGVVGCGCCAESNMEDVIALIKGETNG